MFLKALQKSNKLNMEKSPAAVSGVTGTSASTPGDSRKRRPPRGVKDRRRQTASSAALPGRAAQERPRRSGE